LLSNYFTILNFIFIPNTITLRHLVITNLSLQIYIFLISSNIGRYNIYSEMKSRLLYKGMSIVLRNRYSNNLSQHVMKNIVKFNRIIMIIYRYIFFINLEMYTCIKYCYWIHAVTWEMLFYSIVYHVFSGQTY